MPSASIPQIGLGTWNYDTPAQCRQNVTEALELGYRHLDTAQKYENEQAVGDAIAASPVSRDDLFLATKIAESNLEPAAVHETARESLDRLGVDAVDMLYVHWPAITYDPSETLAAFNELVADGLTRHVGLGNFSPALINEASEILDEPPLAVQVEMHPRCQQPDLREYVRDHDMYLVAYCPLMRGGVFDDAELQAIASDAGVSVAQLCLAWLNSKDRVVPIPKASGEAHLRENIESVDVELDPEILDRIDGLEGTQRVVDPPEKGPWNW